MGAINYYTSDYITIGYNLRAFDIDDDFYHDYITDYYEQVKSRLEDEYFYYWDVKIKPGYYEGFSIDIENNFPLVFNNYEEKREALTEISRLKNFLLECLLDFECCAVFPGWCTTYHNLKDSKKLLNKAVKEMRAEVKRTPTEAMLKRLAIEL